MKGIALFSDDGKRVLLLLAYSASAHSELYTSQ